MLALIGVGNRAIEARGGAGVDQIEALALGVIGFEQVFSRDLAVPTCWAVIDRAARRIFGRREQLGMRERVLDGFDVGMRIRDIFRDPPALDAAIR